MQENYLRGYCRSLSKKMMVIQSGMVVIVESENALIERYIGD